MSDFPEISKQDDLSDLAAIDIEQEFLGAMFHKPALIAQNASLRPEDFFHIGHQEIWRVLLEINAKDGAVSPGVVTLHIKGQFDDGDALENYLGALVHNSCLPMYAPRHAAQILDLSKRRAAYELARDALNRVRNLDSPSDEAIAGIIGDLTRITGHGNRRTSTKRQVAEGLVHSMTNPLPCYSTGIAKLDEVTHGGFYQGKLYGFAARKKVGKTILLGSISHNMNLAGTKHLFIPLEMSPDEIEQRNAARHLQFNSIKFLTRDVPDLPKRVASYSANIPDFMVYEHHPGASLDDIRAMISRHIVKNDIKGVILDYWQLVGGKAPRETEEYHLRNVAQTLADIARRENIFIATAAQINQEGNTRGGEGLKLACDQYFTLHREKDQAGAWMQMEESRYTIYQDIGSEDLPGLLLDKYGPHFKDADDY